jgi:hypothetical protein
MTTPTTAELLKYADLQMAAEAFLTNPNGTIRTDLVAALIDGNKHSSKFTKTQAEAFVDPNEGWTVVDQRANTPTGFSGTLFRSNKTGELVMSFRSTEFIDDAARDAQATGALEIKETGFAWGQLRDMQQWYQELTAPTGHLGAGQAFTVTGYSLGGHLASAFNLMYPAAQATFVFNGAGIGGIDPSYTLKQLVDSFTIISQTDYSTNISDPTLKAIYTRLQTAAKNGTPVQSSDLGTLSSLARPNNIDTANPNTTEQALRVEKAWKRIDSIRTEVTRIKGIGAGDGTKPAEVANTDIAQENMDYQMAVLEVSQKTDSTSLLAGLKRAYKGKVNSITLDKQFDITGTTSPSAVANSQWHIGQDVQVFIEDQPLYRGGIGAAVIENFFTYIDVKLLVDNYLKRDFGDTHSLVLLVDSLNVQNTLLQMLPEGQRAGAAGTLKSILEGASNLKKINGDLIAGSDQGKAEGDVLENTLNALADLVLGPTTDGKPRLKGSPVGGTWAETKDKGDYTGRDTFYTVLKEIQDSEIYKAATKGTLAVQLSATSGNIADQARKDFGAYAALHSLSPVAIKLGDASAVEAQLKTQWGTVYDNCVVLDDSWSAKTHKKPSFRTIFERIYSRDGTAPAQRAATPCRLRSRGRCSTGTPAGLHQHRKQHTTSVATANRLQRPGMTTRCAQVKLLAIENTTGSTPV